MAGFTDRFKRVPGTKTTKHYIDTETGEEVSYRQALKRSNEANLSRRSHTAERKERATSRAQEYHADVKDFAARWNKRHRKNKIDYRQASQNGEFLLEQKIKRQQRIEAFESRLPENISTLKQARASYERAVRFVGHDVTGRSVSRQGIRHRAQVRLFRAAELRG